MDLNLYFINALVFCMIIIQFVFFRKIRYTLSKVKSIETKLAKYDSVRLESKGQVFEKGCYKSKFNYLAIGNSITLHEVCDYWWNECGMASTSKNNDYFHRVIKEFKKIYGGG